MTKAQIGLIGLAVMGQNLARNIANNGFDILVYNRTTSVTEETIKKYWNEKLKWAYNLEEFVKWLERPRKIIIMVKAGKPVDLVIESLKKFLDKWDIIIDAGNSWYKDTIRRWEELEKEWINFIWTGVSGGEYGALTWPSIMPWWKKEVYNQVKNIFEAISAKDFDGGNCVSYIWENGAGHYVKMVHNGIEYAIMQIMAEAYEGLKRFYNLSALQIAEIFEEYNKWRLDSYLFDISIDILKQKDEFNNWYLIDFILDKAWNKWTGKWTSMDALDRWIAIPSIAEAVFSRYISAIKEKRILLSKKYKKRIEKIDISLDEYKKQLETSLYLGIISSYAQWLDLIQQTAIQQNWKIDMWEICRIWEWWCIIRSKLLKTLSAFYKKNWNNIHMFEMDEIATIFNKEYENYRNFVWMITSKWLSTPTMFTALSYFDMMTNEVNSANFIQWQRDYFWAHTYERTDRNWIFHTDWEF